MPTDLRTYAQRSHRNSWKKTVGMFGFFASIALILMGAIGLLFMQKPLDESQDVRQQAASDTGLVTLTTNPSAGTTFALNQPSTITLQLNTANLQTDGAELVFHVLTDTFDTPTVSVKTESGLQPVDVDVERVSDGYLVHVVALPGLSSTFSTNANVGVVDITFTPTQAGDIRLSVDADESFVTVHGSNPPKDELKTAAPISFSAGSAITDPRTSPPSSPSAPAGCYYQRVECKNAPCDPVLVCPTATPASSPTSSPSNSPATSPSSSPTASPTASPGTGGVSIKQCNETCSSNSECQTNYRCYEGRCRLATNVTSSSCANPSDQGLNRSCNQYCADTRECASGYTCFFNRCRRPDNPDNDSCVAPSSSTQQSIIQGCNVSCASNRDCGSNLRCYNNQCRLATNPSSTSCQATNQPSVSSIYGTPKGGNGQDEEDNSTGSTTASSSPSVTPQTSASPFSYASSSPRATTKPQMVTGQSSWLSRLGNLPAIGMAIGLGLLALLALILLFRFLFAGKRRKDDDKPGTPTGMGPTTGGSKMSSNASTSPAAAPQASKYEQNLQQKINQLKDQPAQSNSNSNPGLKTATVAGAVGATAVGAAAATKHFTPANARPATPLPNPAAQPGQPVRPATPLPARPVQATPQTTQVGGTPVGRANPLMPPQVATNRPVAPQAPVTQPAARPNPMAPTTPTGSSMMARIRDKGVNPPPQTDN